MRSFTVIATCVAALTVTGCGSRPALNSHGKQVKVVKKEPLHCKELGRYYGRGLSTEYALNNLLNVVGENGGNRVYISRIVNVDGIGSTFVVGNDHTAYGTAFHC